MSLTRWEDRILEALAESFSRTRDSGAGALLGPPYDDVARFLNEAVSRMTDTLRVPLRLTTAVFDLSGILSGAKPFHRLGPQARLRRIEAWRRSRIAPFRDFVHFYESLCLFALYSRFNGKSPD